MRPSMPNLKAIADFLPRPEPRPAAPAAAVPVPAAATQLPPNTTTCPDCSGLAPNPACGRCAGTGIVCETCKGTGHLYRAGLARTSETIECTTCHNAAARGRLAARIRRDWQPATNFVKLSQEPIAQFADTGDVYANALATISRFTEAWPEGVILSLDGNYGTAKTHLLSMIWARAWEAGRSAIYSQAMVIEKMLTNFDGRHNFSVSPELAWDDMAAVSLLLVDEADRYTHKADEGSYFERNFFALVEERLQRGRSIVLAGNDLRRRMHEGVLSRASSSDCAWIDLSQIKDARPHFGRNAPGWLAQRPPLVHPQTHERLE